jgi:hypothetical protein
MLEVSVPVPGSRRYSQAKVIAVTFEELMRERELKRRPE